jgi:hypothetical protein
MTELEKMEAELKELQGKIKRLKEEQAPHFNMSVIDDSISTDYRVSAEPMKNGFRTFLKYMTTLRVKDSSYTQFIATAYTQPKMSEIGNEKIRICNDFLLEIQPILKKYTQIFLELNSKEGRLC